MNLDRLGKGMRKLGRDTVTEVQKMNEIRRINSRINEQKRQIASLYSQIGQKLYGMYKEAPLEGFDMEFQELEERFSTIETYNDQVRGIKGVRICPSCHTEVSVRERYCSACGEKLPEVLHIQEDKNGNLIIEGTASEVTEPVSGKGRPQAKKAKEDAPETEEIREETPEAEEEVPEAEEILEAEEEAPETEEIREETPEAEEI